MRYCLLLKRLTFSLVVGFADQLVDGAVLRRMVHSVARFWLHLSAQGGSGNAAAHYLRHCQLEQGPRGI